VTGFEHAGEDFLHVIEGVLRVELGTGGSSRWAPEADSPVAARV